MCLARLELQRVAHCRGFELDPQQRCDVVVRDDQANTQRLESGNL